MCVGIVQEPKQEKKQRRLFKVSGRQVAVCTWQGVCVWEGWGHRAAQVEIPKAGRFFPQQRKNSSVTKHLAIMNNMFSIFNLLGLHQ